ncbi:MAG: (deoxy)nucleoside triphosphate pyrophosphohydrolase [Candidatus Marinimicrobia bacterium]|nr:(deoxy)nucleoside triphosphate pyrophosphohydrolase [Candidatus Neomarinimicrobiota bacterium]
MIHVSVAILEKEGSLLICQRHPSMPHPLRWEFPGGKVEKDETPQDALVRELKEELNIEVTRLKALLSYPYQYPHQAPCVLHFFRVLAYQGNVENKIFQTIQWVSPEMLTSLDLLEGDREFLTWLESISSY